MAKVIGNEQNVVVRPWWDKSKVVLTGAGLGFVWWIFASLLKRYIVEPIACRNLESADACINSFGVSGDISLIVVSLIAAIILMKAMWPRPIVIVVASAATLWGLGVLMTGFVWYESVIWSLILFAVTYALFSLVGRIRSLVLSVIVAIIVVILVRLVAIA